MNSLLTRLLFGIVLLPSGLTLPAGDFVLTIGGGYAAEGNQASLEKNVLLFQRTIQEIGLSPVRNDIYFADGDDPAADLQVMDRSAVPEVNRLMAEFFGDDDDLGLSYRNHQIPNVRGAATATNVRRWFDTTGQSMKPGDRLIVYVTAHGNESQRRGNEHDTTIAAWGTTFIRMTEFSDMLDRLPQDIEVVLVMVQCYSGGFARLIFDQGDPERGLSRQRRVGVFATVHDRPAAGCTPDVDEANYAEYSTYFLAAVLGKDRTGNTIALPDHDGDGRISIAEAHAYTILSADTIDLPVITSGEYLTVHSRFREKGETNLLGDDESYETVLELASPSQRAVLEGLSEQLNLSGSDRLETAYQESRPRRRRSSRRNDPASRLRREIAKDLLNRWPPLANVLNPLSVSLLTDRQDEFLRVVRRHPDYGRYRKLADDKQAEAGPRNKIVKYERLLRTADNVILAENLRRLGDDEKWAEYQQLTADESKNLGPRSSTAN